MKIEEKEEDIAKDENEDKKEIKVDEFFQFKESKEIMQCDGLRPDPRGK